ncbi:MULTISPECIES: ATP F0F1 synthase subunit B [Devosia]|uniref:ATP synthase subunit b n=1 Tax=Devosia equisanguinis TaxID=2490941 RepID=A0A3S4CB14_9HYPH|nr:MULTISPECIES: ATP F0F1 synthase subunit B [Devosia]ODT47537.1 MAG: ATP F0F1 synthase subunit B [Pelagibacterium sp. SCN 63-126]ODU86350.1 MAG: ATP F0F1 synthase subunit B [Pelagibacterium sp. SCN 63-17]OJX42755.1 MAG: ATP F0F1 synthase subunit B [Devosia sp. 63-57]VDS04072.1 ATP synthase subunit b precursor [Devosia equisanguinis]
MAEWLDNSFFATVGLVLFLGLMIYFGVPKIIAKMLDGKIKQIETDIAEAKRLRTEAAALLVEYEQKRAAAEREAEGIVTAAKQEAERLTVEAKASLEDLVTRRTKAVEDKIAQAEAQALAEVRSRSADIAIEAARAVLSDEMNKNGGKVIDAAIADVAGRLN